MPTIRSTTSTAEASVGRAAYLAFAYVGLLMLVEVLALFFEDPEHVLYRNLYSGAYFDAVIIGVLGIYLLQRSAVAALLLIAFFVLSQVVGRLVQEREILALVSIPFLYWFYKGLYGCITLRRAGWKPSRSSFQNALYFGVGAAGSTALVLLMVLSIREVLIQS